MECADAKLRMEPYATGNLSSPDREAFEAHVERCEGCRLEVELTRAMSGSGDVDDSGGGKDPDPALESHESAGPDAAVDEAPPPEPSDPEISFAEIAPQDDAEPTSISLDALLASAVPSGASAPPAPPASDHDPLANLLPSPPPEPSPAPVERETAAASAAGRAGAPSWDFEPADAKPRSLPPEGSLFFAEEALTRGHEADAKRRSALLRMSLWIAGGVLGVGLLAFAGWIAMKGHPNPAGTSDVQVPRQEIAAGTAEAPPASSEPAPDAALELDAVPPTGQAELPAASPGAAPVLPPGGSGATATAEPGNPVVKAGAADVRSPLPPAPGAAQAPTAAPAPRVAPTARAASRGAAKARAPKSTSASGARALDASKHAAHEASPPAAGEPEVSGREPIPAVTATAAPSSLVTPEPQVTPGRAPAGEPAPRASEAPAPSGPAGSPPVVPSGGASSTPPSAAAGSAPAPGASQAPPASPAAGPATAPDRPIDRIHQATVAAEERGDLAALRTLRGRWRTFIQRTGVGADRIRAKRELADCLWAIQSLTARRSDQRDALLAYRDYILNAPAGGADARSISRGRQLEDALSESH